MRMQYFKFIVLSLCEHHLENFGDYLMHYVIPGVLLKEVNQGWNSFTVGEFLKNLQGLNLDRT